MTAIEARRQRITRAVLFDLEEEIGVSFEEVDEYIQTGGQNSLFRDSLWDDEDQEPSRRTA